MTISSHERPFRRKLFFRLAAILLGLSPFLLLEATLRMTGWSPPVEEFNPVVEFVNPQPLFEADKESGLYRTRKDRLGYFRPEQFPIEKPANEFRIFWLGGSTVQGRPYAIETSFTTWLELALNETDSTRDWNVVNCGGVSYASYRLVPILEEVLEYQPDLILVYSGHNEFLEDRTYGAIKPIREFAGGAQGVLASSKTVQLVRELTVHDESPPPAPLQFPAEVDAMLDYQQGLQNYVRDDNWRTGVQAHFRFNIERMIAMCREHDLPIILFNPPRNLKDCPPFKSLDSPGLTVERKQEIQRLFAGEDDGETRLIRLKQAVRLNPRHAGLNYALAHELLQQLDYEGAAGAFRRACDEDICPLRILTGMQQGLLQLAESTHTPLIDIEVLFRELSPTGVPGEQLFLDHVHPTIEGHQTIALRTLERMQELKLVPVSEAPEINTRISDRFRESIAELDPIYFAEGQRRLGGLLRWAAGRGDKIRRNPAASAMDR
ncbi:SGNH/GDSL hydrolase family protein [Rubinisphaera margarita]|uniref:SGNH/GDSL hydrolase family protein n=1 Tax=Rubinisphaera margarita TaxID=2909586 RepID=UPI001EE83A39|nr:SGNH/GDSL hydrolase family protein [Rubinisphaera margarita]MCG6156673.1 hypothetical protein [Rubinisphaera margarita]